jgi:DNA-binding PadR family transcriptional regulator
MPMYEPIHKNYTRLTPKGVAAVDQTFNEIQKYLFLIEHISTAKDDRAERLVEAIATFIIDSKPENIKELVMDEEI